LERENLPTGLAPAESQQSRGHPNAGEFPFGLIEPHQGIAGYHAIPHRFYHHATPPRREDDVTAKADQVIH
jgi:hypothetical protein